MVTYFEFNGGDTRQLKAGRPCSNSLSKIGRVGEQVMCISCGAGVNVIEVGIFGVEPGAFGDIGAGPFIGALDWLLGRGYDSSSINGSEDAMFLRVPSLQFPDFVNHLAIEAKL
ncbi:unnamed protein product [Polarella glacialis]|uniref:Uncharacterized protein n=1 Tax=Polarella glacialis TaxID=89957 RepID=A0A813DPQ6_POLGL|nr:unnamed protein product [Polarella glacialis]